MFPCCGQHYNFLQGGGKKPRFSLQDAENQVPKATIKNLDNELLFQSGCTPTNSENVGQNSVQMFSYSIYSPFGQCMQIGNGLETAIREDATLFQQDAACSTESGGSHGGN